MSRRPDESSTGARNASRLMPLQRNRDSSVASAAANSTCTRYIDEIELTPLEAMRFKKILGWVKLQLDDAHGLLMQRLERENDDAAVRMQFERQAGQTDALNMVYDAITRASGR